MSWDAAKKAPPLQMPAPAPLKATPEDQPPDLGPCCACGIKGGPMVQNMLTLARRAPIDGYGWGCGIPGCCNEQNGAIAIFCDACQAGRRKIVSVVAGPMVMGMRMPVSRLVPEAFGHNPTIKHPEQSGATTPNENGVIGWVKMALTPLEPGN